MRDEDLYEDADVGVLRQEVMGRLDTLVKAWVRKVTEHLGMGEHMLAEANAKIFTFGSYRLGVHLPGELVVPVNQPCLGGAGTGHPWQQQQQQQPWLKLHAAAAAAAGSSLTPLVAVWTCAPLCTVLPQARLLVALLLICELLGPYVQAWSALWPNVCCTLGIQSPEIRSCATGAVHTLVGNVLSWPCYSLGNLESLEALSIPLL